MPKVRVTTFEDGTVNKYGLAKHLGVSVRTIENYVIQKRIPVMYYSPRVMRFKLEEVSRALARRTVKEVTTSTL